MSLEEKTELKIIGERIKKIRKEKKVMQAELAEKMEVSPITISRIENGSTGMGILTLKRMADSLEVSVEEITG